MIACQNAHRDTIPKIMEKVLSYDAEKTGFAKIEFSKQLIHFGRFNTDVVSSGKMIGVVINTTISDGHYLFNVI